MDFAKLDLRNTSEEKYWVHLRLGDTLLFSDMDNKEGACRVQVAAASSNEVKASLKAALREADQVNRVADLLAQEENTTKRDKYSERLVKLDRSLDETLTRFLMAAVKDWENIEFDGAPLKFSQDSLAELSKIGAPLHRMANEIASDLAKAQSPFTKAANG